MKIFVSSLMLGLGLMTALDASAQSYPREDSSAVTYGYARVIDVQPVYDKVPASQPAEVCWEEPVSYASEPPPRYYRRNETQEIVGGIIGGLIGNQFGHGDGRAAATFAGVALGSAVARDDRRNRGYYREDQSYVQTRMERRCEVRENYQQEERLMGYEVSYDYQGAIGHTFTEHDPGEQIRVRVAVEATQ